MKRMARCERCYMHIGLCICDMIPQIVTKTRLTLIIHAFEIRKPTNTGRLACECLSNSQLFVRGLENRRAEPEDVLDDSYQSVVLFPSERAEVLTPEVLARYDRPVNLIVPDGNWRQATRIPKREPALQGLPHVILQDERPSQYRLRFEPRKPYGLATMEAIARAFGVIEGREVEEQLDHVFRTMVERSLWTKGKLTPEQVYGGIPERAQQLLKQHATEARS